MAAAGLRIAKQGAVETGGSRPSKRSPAVSGGSSAETIGAAAWTSVPTWLATSRMIRSTCAGSRTAAGVRAARAQPIDRQRTIGVDHDFDTCGIGERGGDVRPKRGAQHRALRGSASPPRSSAVLRQRKPRPAELASCSDQLDERGEAVAADRRAASSAFAKRRIDRQHVADEQGEAFELDAGDALVRGELFEKRSSRWSEMMFERARRPCGRGRPERFGEDPRPGCAGPMGIVSRRSLKARGRNN